MGKKKKNKGEEVQVYCWYCERKFEDEKVLVAHQKAKHFKCHVCHKKLTTAGGMVVHVFQVHKENITKVPNSKPGRDSVKYEIYGMEGIPEDEGLIGDDENPNKKPRLDNGPSVPLLPTPLYSGPTGLYQNPGFVPQSYNPYPGVASGPWTPGATGMLPPPSNVPPQFSGSASSATNALPNGGRPPPLFPIQPGSASAGVLPTPGYPAHSQQPLSPSQALLPPPYMPGQPLQQDAYLVYDDETMSVEEKRAELERYKYDEEVLKQQMNKIDQSIEFRVSQMIGNRVGGM